MIVARPFQVERLRNKMASKFAILGNKSILNYSKGTITAEVKVETSSVTRE